ncbi:serine/threonine protein kinase [Cylindrospermum stagnale PCC 7417]|uniref:non-specific serine/threonine protein kinase n=1 Tax=Cylindrospermum stagnale PCC 7417 TaxID=56107 RepID=K9WY34_9NOST|nr:serine/threonine-protein kinase [Cylindrospermum stagnale]AFZ24427.1 serine/threonine protein kinase [Cylindrospermum stagnale PCC 7417]
MPPTKVQDMDRQKAELDIYIGKFLNNRYLIRDLIGKGGMGRVYLAEDAAKGGLRVAVKILLLNLINQHMSQRFGREIFIGAQLGRKSKNIVRVLSYGVTEEKVPFYVMEYLEGKNLKQILNIQPLTISNFLDICQQICLGLQCAHQGISLKGEIYPVVHRDIKPENIFINDNAKKSELVKILDFGIAKFLTERSGMTLTDSFIGSLPYSSPEHMEGRKLLDVRSDIYSLGVLMFEMLTGKHPFQLKSNSFGSWYQAHRFQAPPTFAEVNPQARIPQDLQKLVMNCLAKDTSDRPQNMGQILEVLVHVKEQLEDEPSISNIEQYLPPSPVQLVPVTTFSEKECLQKTWPKNKPVATIGFPHLLHTPQGTVPTFWAMLPREEITKFLDKTHSTEFITKMNLYPMVLWVTVLYDDNFSLTRWLSYFLDLKDSRGQKLMHILSEIGYYHLLFFAIEEPTNCNHVMTFTLTASQRQQLADCLDMSQKSNELISPNQAKTILKTEYEKLKLEVNLKLATPQKNETLGLKAWIAKLFDNLF